MIDMATRWFTGISPDMLAGFMAQGGARLIGITADGTHGRFTVADLLQMLHKGDIQLWAAGEGDFVMSMALSEIVNYPRTTVLRLFGLAGRDLAALVPYMGIIKAWALEQGCSEIGLEETRAGLELAIPGFERAGVCLRMPLDAAHIPTLATMHMEGAA